MGFSGGGSGDILDGSITEAKLSPLVLTPIRKRMSEVSINVLTNSASASSNNAYDDMYLDILSSAGGYDSTIDTGNTTAIFDTDKYKNGGGAPDLKDEDTADVQDTNSTWHIVKTYNYTSPNILSPYAKIDLRSSQNGHAIHSKVKFTYDDDTTFETADQSQAVVGQVWGTKTHTNTSPTKAVKKIEFYIDSDGGSTSVPLDECRYKNIRTYESSLPSNKIVQTNAESIEADPSSHQVFCHNSLAGSGSVTYDISFDGGTTWDTGNALNTSNTSLHTGSSMILKLNLNGTGDGNTAEVSDYALMLGY